MWGKRLSLRLGSLALVVVLIFGALGSLSLAGDAFDDDYDDCPAVTRLDAVSGLAIDRTDENDEIRIRWDQLETAALSGLGTNAYRARLTVIVEGGGDHDAMNLALAETSLVVDEVSFTEALTVSVAVTQGDYVISDIAEADFTSGMPAPSFSTDVRVTSDAAGAIAVDPDDTSKLKDLGNFYYLGFNDLYDNWYLSATASATLVDRPSTPKFRVGLAHGGTGLDLDEADFENYRIVIEDSSGDLLGYQAETVAAAGTYDTNVIVFGETQVTGANVTAAATEFTNIRLSNQVGENGAVSSYYAIGIGTDPGDAGLSYGNVAEVDADAAPAVNLITDIVFAEPPAEYFDFPRDVFEADGSYIIKAWAEDDEGTRISPQASITLSVQEQQSIADGRYEGYVAGFRQWNSAAVGGNNLTVFGFSIQDE